MSGITTEVLSTVVAQQPQPENEADQLEPSELSEKRARG